MLLTVSSDAGAPGLPDFLFERQDDDDDALFYAEPRFVAHIDAATIDALTGFYAERLPSNGRVLDLMSSWISHLPEDASFAHVAGHGMNAAELAANARLDDFHVQNLNSDARLPWDDAAFDAVLIAVSVQYLVNPIAVFDEIGRLLAPGGEVIIATSHRCFPTKAVRAFHALPPGDRLRMYAECLRRTGRFEAPEATDRSPADADPLWLLHARRRGAVG